MHRPSKRPGLRLGLWLGLALTVGQPHERAAYAQDFEAAGQHFVGAQEAFKKKSFAKAATEFKAAYDITRDPVLLFNIGESYDKAKKAPLAVQFYRQYLVEATAAQDRETVKARVEELETQYHLTPPTPAAAAPATADLAKPAPAAVTPAPVTTAVESGKPAPASEGAATADAAKPAPPVAPALTPEQAKNAVAVPAPPAVEPAVASAEKAGADSLAADKPGAMKITAWVGVATTVALLTSGAVCGLAAQDRSDEISRRQLATDASGAPPKFTPAEEAKVASLRSEGQTYNGLAIGLMSASAATAVVSAVLFIIDAKRHEGTAPQKSVRITPAVSHTGAGLAATVEF